MLTGFLRDRVKWHRQSPVDEWGEPAASVDVSSVPARIEYAQNLVRTLEGAEVTASGHLLVAERPLPGDAYTFDGVKRQVVAVTGERRFSQRLWRADFT